MNTAPLDSNQWHDAIVGDLTVRQVVDKIEQGRNPWAPAVLGATSPGEALLELGCGTGVFSGILAKNGRRTTLLDFSSESVEFCRMVFEQAQLAGEFVQADVCRAFPFADRSFDCVWSSGLLEHFTDEQLSFIMGESARVSRRCVVSLVPNARSVFYRVGKAYQEAHGLWRWGREDPKRTLKPFFVRAGLADVREFAIDVKTALDFACAIRSPWLRRPLLLLSRLLPEAGWNTLRQGYLLVTVGRKANPSGDSP